MQILNSNRLGTYIKLLRLEKNLTQKFVAQEIGCSGQFLGKIESEQVQIPKNILISLINYLDISEEKIVSLYKQNYIEGIEGFFKRARVGKVKKHISGGRISLKK